MLKIFVVEDNEVNRDMIGRRLQRLGHEVHFAEDGEAALAIAEILCFDLILMDIGLPGMNGYECTKALRKLTPTEDTPIIALTAHALQSDHDRAFEAGCDEFETKPIDFDRLLTKISALTSATVAQHG